MSVSKVTEKEVEDRKEHKEASKQPIERDQKQRATSKTITITGRGREREREREDDDELPCVPERLRETDIG